MATSNRTSLQAKASMGGRDRFRLLAAQMGLGAIGGGQRWRQHVHQLAHVAFCFAALAIMVQQGLPLHLEARDRGDEEEAVEQQIDTSTDRPKAARPLS